MPKSKDNQERPLDPVGAFLSIGALGSILYAIIEAPSHGWTSMETLGVAALGLLFTLVFIRWEKRVEHPMLPIEFFSSPGFRWV